MAILRQCCCGVSLRTGSLAICYWTLATELLKLIILVSTPDNQPSRSIFLRSESSYVRFSRISATVVNTLVTWAAIYGIHKHKAPFMIPYIMNRIVTIAFSSFNVFNARQIANSLNETMENSLNNERDETFDTLPVVVCILIAFIALDVYFLLVVHSYYQALIVSATVIAVALPISTYTVRGHDHLDSMYEQPPSNPYLIADGKIPPMQHDPYLPTYGYQYYGPPYGGRSSMTNLPPPYRP